jgi:fatty acid amide hydrolase 2
VDISRLSALALADRIRRGTLTSRDAVEAHIAAVERVNPAVNAVVATRFAEARREADEADAAVRRGADLGPFHGVPMTVKESFAVAGMPQTAGLVARRGTLARGDAVTVARLRRAGAIPLGVTNTSELCMWMESANHVYGRTSNPYDAGRIAGGSSGGEGAIVGAGGSPMGLGADIGGSIRMPAFFCGVFGHKPTGGLVPGTGQFPFAENAARRYLSTGPIARRAEDLWPFLQVVAGPDGEDTGALEYSLGDPRDVSFRGLTVVSIPDNGTINVSDVLVDAQERCLDELSRRGARVRTTRVKGLRASLGIWSAMMSAAADTSFRTLLGQGRPIGIGRELARWAVGRSPHTFAALALALVEGAPMWSGSTGERLVAAGKRLQGQIEDLIGDGVLLFPSYPEVAPRHGAPLLRPMRWVYTAIVNVLELPSTQVPLGLDARGLPLGVQVVGARGRDHVTIAVACELERAFGGWVPPPRLWR